NSFGILELNLNQGVDKKIPIGISFSSKDKIANTILNVFTNDLEISKEFTVHEYKKHFARNLLLGNTNNFPENIDYMVAGEISLEEDRIIAKIKFFDLFSADKLVFDKEFIIHKSHLRKLGHHISNQIYEKITGIKGIFATKIAYVKRLLLSDKSLRYELVIADVDGFNEKPLLRSRQPITSVSWSNDGKQIACVSFEKNKPEIYIININSGKRRLVSSFKGINSAPKFSPDGRKLAVVLSKSGHPNIYLYDISEGVLQRITRGASIDTEPEWSKDGEYIYFASDRGNKGLQIYKSNITNLKVSQITFTGRYNSSPQLNPKGDQILMLHRDKNGYNLAVQNLVTNDFKVITNSGFITNPSISPNGKMVIFTSSENNRKELKLLTINKPGVVELKITGRDIIKPAWGPIV
ncbi:MAG: Tol-Pal system beta propeller repeat protein TolB, partial [Legionellales bacterium]|nr:Tol-Pal system beta propeller repeat protein TolB [Legionellales bacterium]